MIKAISFVVSLLFGTLILFAAVAQAHPPADVAVAGASGSAVLSSGAAGSMVLSGGGDISFGVGSSAVTGAGLSSVTDVGAPILGHSHDGYTYAGGSAGGFISTTPGALSTGATFGSSTGSSGFVVITP